MDTNSSGNLRSLCLDMYWELQKAKDSQMKKYLITSFQEQGLSCFHRPLKEEDIIVFCCSKNCLSFSFTIGDESVDVEFSCENIKQYINSFKYSDYKSIEELKSAIHNFLNESFDKLMSFLCL